MSQFLAHLKANGKKIDEEIAAVFAKYNIKIVGRSARVDAAEGTYKFKVQFATAEGVEAQAKKAEDNFRFYASMVGMKPEWFGKKFRMGDKVYTIAGYRPSRRKNPVELTANGKGYCASPDQVRAFMTASPVT